MEPPGSRLPSQRGPPAPPAGPAEATPPPPKNPTGGSESADYRKTSRLSKAGLFCCSEMDTRSGGGRPRLQPQGLSAVVRGVKTAGREALATFFRGLCLLPYSNQEGVWLRIVAAGCA